MKKITLLLMLFVSYCGFAQFPAPYCGPIAFTTNVEPITLVEFAGINNSSTATAAVASGAHENYTAVFGSVVAGSSYTITLKGNTDGNYTNRFMVFADWNQDGDFADANEAYTITQTILNSTGVDAVFATQLLTVPGSALAGNTRMRVKKIFGTTNYTDPCLGAAYGQVEDYSLTVTVPSCAAPSAGVATVTSSTTANLSWTSGGAANAEVKIQPAGTGTPATANDTGVNVTGNTYAASSLSPMTA
ncbi:MAG: GEVED domain-containing protein, partial [Flavobacterium sp.]